MNSSVPQNPQFQRYYQKHVKCLKLSGLQPKTIDAYSRALRRLGNYFEFRIDDLSSDQLLDYFNDLLLGHSWSTVKLDLYGLQFFYTHVLNKTWNHLTLIKAPKTRRIPDILSCEQLNRLFSATSILSYKVFFFTIYSLGLRLGEGINLKVGDIRLEGSDPVIRLLTKHLNYHNQPKDQMQTRKQLPITFSYQHPPFLIALKFF